MIQTQNIEQFQTIDFILTQYYSLKLLKYSTLNSYEDINYLVIVQQSDASKKYVLKLNRIATVQQIQAENSIMQYLHPLLKQVQVQCSLPIKSSQGKYYHQIDKNFANYIIRLFQFIEGQLLYFCPYKSSFKAYEHFGKIVGLITQHLQNYKPPLHTQKYYRSKNEDVWYLNNTLKIRDYMQYIKDQKLRNEIVKFLQQFQKIVKQLDKLPVQIIHGDLHNQNIFVGKNYEKIIGVIDFGVIHQSCALFQIAIAMASSMHIFSGNTMNQQINSIQACKSVFKGYCSVNKISEKCIRLLYYLINARNCTEIVMNRYQYSFDQENEYLIDSEVEMIASFRQLNSITEDQFVEFLLKEQF